MPANHKQPVLFPGDHVYVTGLTISTGSRAGTQVSSNLRDQGSGLRFGIHWPCDEVARLTSKGGRHTWQTACGPLRPEDNIYCLNPMEKILG